MGGMLDPEVVVAVAAVGFGCFNGGRLVAVLGTGGGPAALSPPVLDAAAAAAAEEDDCCSAMVGFLTWC